MMFVVIAFCEVAFWILLAGGLAVRYLLKMPRLSVALLLSVPLLDVLLLAVSVFDLRGGAEAELVHGLAAAYLGYSVAFGHRTIRWADARFAHRFADGPPPPKPPESGTWARAKHEWAVWVRILLAYAVAWAVTGIMVVLVGEAEHTDPLVTFTLSLVKVPLIAAAWPLSYSYSAFKRPASRQDQVEADPRLRRLPDRTRRRRRRPGPGRAGRVSRRRCRRAS